MELAEFLGTLRRSYQINPFALVRNVVWRCGLRPLGGLALHRLFPDAHAAGRVKRLLAGDPAWLALDPDLRVEHQHRAAQAMGVSDPPHGFYIRELRTSLDHTLISWAAEERSRTGQADRDPFSASVLRPGSGRDALPNAAPALERGRPFQGTGAPNPGEAFSGPWAGAPAQGFGTFRSFRRSCFGKGQPWPIWPATSLRSQVLVLSMDQLWLPSSARR